jgi:DDE superfamily endonuclease
LVPDRPGAAQTEGRGRHRHRPGRPGEKKLIEDAYTLGESLGLSVWCCDQAGPFQTVPYPGQNWRLEGAPARQPHEYTRNGTAKVLTLFHPADGEVRLKGVTGCPNEVLHGWLKQELTAILGTLPPVTASADGGALRESWQRWQQGLTVKPTLAQQLPPLRMLLVLDNLAGHKTPEFVLWLFAHGVMPLYTPLSGSWLNMAESIQRILKRRALSGQPPSATDQIITWFEAVAGHWNEAPTPFEWGGKRKRRRERQRERRHRVGGSGAYTRKPLRSQESPSYGHTQRK